MIIGTGLILTNPRRNTWLGIGIVFIGLIVAIAVFMLQSRQLLPVKTITLTKADGTTEAYTGRVRTKHYLECPECGRQFTGSSVGFRSDGGTYYRDPDNYATKQLRLHLTHIHRYERLQAGKTARTASFKYEDRPA
jgi:hypothetical protein